MSDRIVMHAGGSTLRHYTDGFALMVLVEVSGKFIYDGENLPLPESKLVKTVIVRICTLIICLSILIPRSSLALSVKPKTPPKRSELGGLSFTPTIGYLLSGADTFDSTVLYGAKISYDMLGKGLADDLGVDGTLNFFTSKSKIDGSTANGYLFRVDAIYPFLTRDKLIPFFAFGLGGISTSSASHSELNTIFNYGAGLKYFFENYLALRVDARQLFMLGNGDIQDNFELTVGMSYFFGKERKKKTPPPAPKPIINPIPRLEEKPEEPPPAPKPVLPEVSEKIIALEGKAQVESLASEADASATQAKSSVLLTPGTMIAVQSGQQPSAPLPASPEELARARQAAIIEGQPRPFKVVKIEFDSNRLNVKPKYDKQLQEIVAVMKSSTGSAVKVEGYADISGKNAGDKKFALERAYSVLARLEKFGADPGRITTIGYGYALSSTDTATTSGRQKKRQPVVTVTVLVYSAEAAQIPSPGMPDTGLTPVADSMAAVTPTTMPRPAASAAAAVISPDTNAGAARGGTSAVPVASLTMGQNVGKVLAISGNAIIERGRSRLAVRENSGIQAGDVIVTAAKARVRILFSGKRDVTLSGKSRLVVRDFLARKTPDAR